MKNVTGLFMTLFKGGVWLDMIVELRVPHCKDFFLLII